MRSIGRISKGRTPGEGIRFPDGNAVRRGLSLVEVAMGIGLTALVSIGVMQITSDQTASGKAASAATMLSQVQAASQDYMKANYQQLVTAVPVGAVPIAIRTGRPSLGAAIPAGPAPGLTSVQGGGFLPTTFIDRDNYRYRHVLLVRQPVAGTLEGLVVQVSDAELGLGADGGTAIRDTDLGRIVARMGGAGGARFATNPVAGNAAVVQGNGGSWATSAADWAASGFTPQTGRAAATVSFGNAALLSDYLNRYDIGIPEANTMRAGLNMGTNSITAANDVGANTVTANSQVLAGTGAVAGRAARPGLSMYMDNGGIACAGNATGCKFWISDDGGFADYNDGWIRFQGNYASGGLSIEGAGNNLYVGGDVSTNGTVSANGSMYSQTDMAAARDIGAGRNLSAGGTMYAASDITSGRDIGAGRNLYAGGTMYAGDDVVSGRDIGSGRNLYATGTAYAGDDVVSGRDIGSGRDLYANRTLVVGQDASIGTNLLVGGDAWLRGYLTVNGSMSVNGSLSVTGDTGLAANANVGQNLAVGGVTTVGQEVRLAGTAGFGQGCAVNGAITASYDGSGRLLNCVNGRWGSPATLVTAFYSIPHGVTSGGDTYTVPIGRHAYCAASEVYNQLNVVPATDYGDGTYEWTMSEPTPAADPNGGPSGATAGGTAACVN